MGGWLGGGRSFWAPVGRWSVFSGAGWACCHRFHFFGGFYGICDTIGREPVTNSIFFAVFMESATNPRSTLVRNMACCHKFHFFSRFYGICDTRHENITSSIGWAYQTAGNAARRLGKPAHTPETSPHPENQPTP